MTQQLSLFIPYVFPNISRERIAEVFDGLHLGLVSRVDLVDQGKHNRAYIHFEYWTDSVEAAIFQQRIRAKERVEVTYKNPYYWIVLENTSKYDPAQVGARKLTLQLNDGGSGIVASGERFTVSKTRSDDLKRMLGVLPDDAEVLLVTSLESEYFKKTIQVLQDKVYDLEQENDALKAMVVACHTDAEEVVGEEAV
jgi:hypothetical protein